MKSLTLLLIILPALQARMGEIGLSFLHSRQYVTPASIAQNDFEVFSNPAGGEIKILFNSPKNGNGYLSLYSESGTLLSRKRIPVMAGKNVWNQKLPTRSSNTYSIIFRMDSIERKTTVFKSVRHR